MEWRRKQVLVEDDDVLTLGILEVEQGVFGRMVLQQVMEVESRAWMIC